VAIFLLVTGSNESIAARSSGSKENPRYASIVLEATTGKILHQEHADATRHPASLTKVMTLLILFDQMKAGKVELSDRIRISKRAASMSPTKLGIPAGGSITVRDAIAAIVTESANDISVAMAEHLAGSETNFAKHMTRRAQQIGMSRTRFKNASGLPDKAQITTARDMARMAKFILTYYPQYYKFFGMGSFTYKGVTHVNHNRLMQSYPGMDGFKTGFINASGFNLIASAKQNGIRIIGVVFGGRSAPSRNAHMKDLLDDGFVVARRLYYAGGLNSSSTEAVSVPQEQIREPILKPSSVSKPQASVSAGTIEPRFDQVMKSYAVTPNERTVIAQPDNKPIAVPQNYAATQSRSSEALTGEWAIQIGAYQDRSTTDQALYNAQKALPSHLAKAQPVIVPIRSSDATWMFRARLAGFTRDEALQACGYFRDCMTVAPAM
jgi:D-alanyl-D-alanine carboxypeptidase